MQCPIQKSKENDPAGFLLNPECVDTMEQVDELDQLHDLAQIEKRLWWGLLIWTAFLLLCGALV